jgi:hypothetical protein
MKFRSALLEMLHLDGRTERKKEQQYDLVSFQPRNLTNRHKANVYCCRLLPTNRVPFIFSVLLQSTFTVQILYNLQLNSTSSNLLKLLLHVQLHKSTAHLLHKYCTNCTVCNWTLLTVIKQKLPLHIQLHKRTQTVQLLFSEVQCSRLF